MPRVIIAATTDAANSEGYIVRPDYPLTFTTYNLAGVETADVQIKYDDSNYHDLYEDGTQAQMTTTNNSIQIIAPGIYRIAKGATVGAASVSLSTIDKP